MEPLSVLSAWKKNTLKLRCCVAISYISYSWRILVNYQLTLRLSHYFKANLLQLVLLKNLIYGIRYSFLNEDIGIDGNTVGLVKLYIFSISISTSCSAFC